VEVNRRTAMPIYRHIPGPPLDQHIDWFWYYVDYQPDHDRQHVLPEGTFELMINLEDRPRKLFNRLDPNRHDSFQRSWLSGAHAGYLIIDALPGSSMIGAHFKPGGAAPFLGLPAGELGEQVVELDAIWGAEVGEWRERLQTARGSQAKFRLFEQLLRHRLTKAAADANGRKGVRWALDRFLREPHLQSIRAVSTDLGVSHKHFTDQFRREVGLTPKLFCRIRRFQEVLGQIHSRKAIDWADVACSCGYFDQAHFVHDFTDFAGLNPSRYLVQRLQGDPNFIRVLD
jgi:AraC-like DNA-binding protein